MIHVPLTLATLVLGILLGQGAEPGPDPLPSPVADPIPHAVHIAATKLAVAGSTPEFDVITRQQRTLYQVKMIDAATNQPALATFAGDGSLVSFAPIPPHEAQPVPSVPPLDAPQTPADPALPPRADGRDAAPATRRGIEEPTR